MNGKKKLTWDDIKEMFAETDRRFKETAQTLAKRRAEADEEFYKRREADEEEYKKRREESDRRLAKIERLVGGIGNNNGEMAEEYFFNAFKSHKYFANEQYDYVQRPLRITNGNLEAEFDIILFNCKSVAIIEVKYNAKPDNIRIDYLISRVEIFKILYPNYKSHKIYLGVAAMSFNGKLVKELHEAGIATVHQIGKKMVVYDKDVQVF